METFPATLYCTYAGDYECPQIETEISFCSYIQHPVYNAKELIN